MPRVNETKRDPKTGRMLIGRRYWSEAEKRYKVGWRQLHPQNKAKTARKSTKTQTKTTYRRGMRIPRGYILRKGYTYKRADGTVIRVRPTLIKDRGAKGKGKKIWSVKAGALSPYKVVSPSTGKIIPAAARRRTLARVIARKSTARKSAAGEVNRRLNAIRNYSKNTPSMKMVYRALSSDIEWVKKHYTQKR